MLLQMLVLISNATTIKYLCLGTHLYILHNKAKQNKINQMITLLSPEFMKKKFEVSELIINPKDKMTGSW